MFKLYRNGNNLINNAIYEYVCDSEDDLEKIPRSKINLGSTAIVVDAENGLKVFIADSNDEWIELDADNSSSGGSGSSTYKLTAEKIKTALGIDVPAKITEIETKNTEQDEQISSLGGSVNKYELLNTITADGTYAAISSTKDDDGNDYNLSKAYIKFIISKGSSTTSLKTFVNDSLVGNNANAISTTGSTTSPNYSYIKIEINSGMIEALSTAAATSSSNLAVSTYGNLLKDSESDYITKIEIASASSSVLIPEGSIIKIYGVKR